MAPETAQERQSQIRKSLKRWCSRDEEDGEEHVVAVRCRRCSARHELRLFEPEEDA